MSRWDDQTSTQDPAIDDSHSSGRYAADAAPVDDHGEVRPVDDHGEVRPVDDHGEAGAASRDPSLDDPKVQAQSLLPAESLSSETAGLPFVGPAAAGVPSADGGSDGPSSDGRIQDGDPGSRALVPDSDTLSSRWDAVQADFVDDPRQAVAKAGALVEDVLARLADSFNVERGRLEQQWETGGEPSTEDLRQAIQLYRDFFQRLLAA